MSAAIKPKVLVIDDDAEMVGMVRDTLAANEFEVICAQSGEQGLRLARRESMDVIIIDILMPGKDGLETIMDLRHSQSAAKIIAISGGGTFHLTNALDWAERIGAKRTLRKPFTPEELLAAVRECVDMPNEPSRAT